VGFGGAAAAAGATAAAAGSRGLARGRAAAVVSGLELREVLSGEDLLPLVQLIRAPAGGRHGKLEDRQRLGEDALPDERLRREPPLLALPGEQRLRGQDEPRP